MVATIPVICCIMEKTKARTKADDINCHAITC
jgi:hypothetical protein